MHGQGPQISELGVGFEDRSLLYLGKDAVKYKSGGKQLD